MANKLLVESFSLAGYRSFGATIQRFEKLAKINLFIGQNNCGKSNVLRFIHDVYPLLSKGKVLKLDPIDRHMPSGTKFVAGVAVSLEKEASGEYEAFNREIGHRLKPKAAQADALRVFQKKAELDGSKHTWFDFGSDLKLIDTPCKESFDLLNDQEIYDIWRCLANQTGGDRDIHWYPESLDRL